MAPAQAQAQALLRLSICLWLGRRQRRRTICLLLALLGLVVLSSLADWVHLDFEVTHVGLFGATLKVLGDVRDTK